jgi:hypothetical protein
MFFDVVRSIVFDLNGTLVVERYLRPDDMLERVLKCQRRGRKLSSEDLKGVARGEWSLAKVIAKIYDVKNPRSIKRVTEAVSAYSMLRYYWNRERSL